MSDFDASWDSVIDVEKAAYERGHADGLRDAEEEGQWQQEGMKAGYMRGFALGLEIGFMETVASGMLESGASAGRQPYNGAGDSTGAMAAVQSSEATRTRHAKSLVALVESSKAVPNENAPVVDFDGKVRELRALYKVCAPPAGPFRRTTSRPDPTLGW